MSDRLSLPASVRRRRWPRALLNALLPSVCALCGGGCDGVVCAGCQAAYVLPRVRCARCANPLPDTPSSRRRPGPNLASPVAHADLGPGLRRDDGICGACLSDTPAFDATVAAADYAAPLDQLVLQLKFGARLALAPWCARMLRDAVLARGDLVLPDLLCPVPLGAERLAGRGFNQALEIARPLAGALGVALHPRLAARTLETVAQSGVAPAQRGRNVRGAFAVTDPDLVAGRHVGLVDDVMTSGHTLGELAATLKRFGAARVTNLVFARTPPHD
ncbi:ComF family protein [Massilia sp. YIM B02763]|uniref:ComF family protein n=1 Tax=Massilia sp. YIM B02763 TaxID=3050130 RepID=UPI0025B6B26B|nr:ComF family protein [Massilia sp. YIM B02763]MDN4053263.1 ComF family protein [Massilia sp. YIM B02763]